MLSDSFAGNLSRTAMAGLCLAPLIGVEVMNIDETGLVKILPGTTSVAALQLNGGTSASALLNFQCGTNASQTNVIRWSTSTTKMWEVEGTAGFFSILKGLGDGTRTSMLDIPRGTNGVRIYVCQGALTLGPMNAAEPQTPSFDFFCSRKWRTNSSSPTQRFDCSIRIGENTADDNVARQDHYDDMTIYAHKVTMKNGPNDTQLYVNAVNCTQGKAFQIDHPLAPTERDLYHMAVESPQYNLIYRGVVTLVKGQAVVSIDIASRMTPGTFAVLTKNPDIFLQNRTGWDPVKGQIQGDQLTIVSKDRNSTDSISWMVVAERNDPTIRTSPLVDAKGSLVPERNKEPVSAADLEDRAEDDESIPESGREEVVDNARGKRGYVISPMAYPDAPQLPKRKVLPRRNGHNGR